MTSTTPEVNGGLTPVAGESATVVPAPEPHSSAPATKLRTNCCFDDCILQKNERRVLVIYTGGTIGMVRSARGALAPLPHTLEKTLRRFPNMHDDVYAKSRFGDVENCPLVLPEMMEENSYRVMYTIFEYDPLLDSTDMTMADWVQIAKDIKANYEHFDGFVILHGTDTMAYTASALSFMMDNLGKSVVITGSQIPLFEIRSDGRENFLGALILAGNYAIPEVTVYFGQKLFRGNRITKVSSDSLNAFDSPNMAPIAVMGINIEVSYNLIFRPKDIAPFNINTSLNRNVGLLRLFPSITPETVRVFLQEPTLGVVLQTYGSGNFPTNRHDLLLELEAAAKRGVLIVNCTQCGHGSVSTIYETGQAIVEAGVIMGYDMTPEAALTKLSYVLGRADWSIEKKREMMQKCLKGELDTHDPSQHKHENKIGAGAGDGAEGSIVENVTRTIVSTLNIDYSSDEQLTSLEKIVGPPLLCSLMKYYMDDKDEQSLEKLFDQTETIIALGDYSGRTALHVAAALGDTKTVEFLLKKGAPVHVRDSRGYSPLRDAIEHDCHEVIEILRKCGAHLTLEPKALGAELNLATCRGDIKRLKSFLLAGANLNQVDPTGRAPLHVAVESNHPTTLNWLLTIGGVSPCIKNSSGQTAMDLAVALQNKELVDVMNSTFSSKTNGQCIIM